MKLGKRLKKLRKGMNWTQENLADYCGKSVRTIVGIEQVTSEQRFTMSTLRSVARALGYNVNREGRTLVFKRVM